MSFFQNPSFYIQTAEADVVQFFRNIEAKEQVLAQDFVNAVTWVQSNAAEIASLLASLLGVAASATSGNIPAVLITAQTALGQGMNLLNQAVAAAQASQAAGGNANAQALALLASAYAAFKQAEAGTATAAGTTASPAPATAS